MMGRGRSTPRRSRVTIAGCRRPDEDLRSYVGSPTATDLGADQEFDEVAGVQQCGFEVRVVCGLVRCIVDADCGASHLPKLVADMCRGSQALYGVHGEQG
jgi:hypothetical protein